MKLSTAMLLIAAAMPSAAAWVVMTPQRATTVLSSQRLDASEAIAAAVAAGKKFGPTSPEARVAWDVVEELDASDNSAAYAGSLDTECGLEDEKLTKACEEYEQKLQDLEAFMAKSAPKAEAAAPVSKNLSDIKMSPAPSKPAAPSPQIKAVLQAAQAAEKKYGKGSPEARVAWSELEDVAAAGVQNALGGKIDEDECLVEHAAACEALDAVNEALRLKMSN